MVSFTGIEYITALTKGNAQEEMIKNLIADSGITEHTAEEEIDRIIHDFMSSTVAAQ